MKERNEIKKIKEERKRKKRSQSTSLYVCMYLHLWVKIILIQQLIKYPITHLNIGLLQKKLRSSRFAINKNCICQPFFIVSILYHHPSYRNISHFIPDRKVIIKHF